MQNHIQGSPSLNDAQDPPTRRRLAALVGERPGVTLSDARRELSIAWGLLAHHLQVLLRQGRVVTVAARGRTLMFPRPTPDAGRLGQGVALHGTARVIARAIVQAPGISASELQWVTGASRRSTYYHVQRLVGDKLVTSEGHRRPRDLRPTDLLVRALLIHPSGEGKNGI